MKQSLLSLHWIACSRYPKLSGCSLCSGCSYPIIWQTINFRVVLINDHSYPGYCRIESIVHIKEMTDLTDALQKECLQLLLNIEKGLRKLLAPDKINLASLGNKTPHLHWHIIPRYKIIITSQGLFGQLQKKIAILNLIKKKKEILLAR